MRDEILWVRDGTLDRSTNMGDEIFIKTESES